MICRNLPGAFPIVAAAISASVIFPALAQSLDAIDCVMTRPSPEVTVLIYGKHAGRFELRFTDGPMLVRRALLETLDLQASPEGTPGEFIIEKLGIGSHIFENVPVIAWDPPDMYDEESAPDGVLTLEVFKDRLITLDVANSEIRISEGDLATDRAALPYTIDAGEDEGDRSLFFEARLGDEPIRMALSTSTQTTIHFSDNAAEKLPLENKPSLIGRVITEKGESTISGSRLALPLVAGSMVLESAEVRFSDLFEIPTLGIASLGEFAITFDPAHQKLQFAKSTRYDTAEPAGEITLIDESLKSIQEAFNRDQEKTRLLMILSPT